MEWVENFYRLLSEPDKLSNAEQNKAYDDFRAWFQTTAQRVLFVHDEYEVDDLIADVIVSLSARLEGRGMPDNPEHYLVVTVHNKLKSAFGRNDVANRYAIKRQLRKVIVNLENDGVIHSMRERTGFHDRIEGDPVGPEVLLGYMYKVGSPVGGLREMILEVIKMAGGVVYTEDLIDQWLQYKLESAPKRVTTQPGTDNGDDTYDPGDSELSPDERMMISETVEETIRIFGLLLMNTPGITNPQMIKIIYMHLGGYTLSEMAEMTGLPQNTVDYYLSARAENAIKMILRKQITCLRGSLPGRGAGEITAYFGNELSRRLKEEYNEYLLDIN
ncbi:MAG: hypothetical protein HBSAPP04_08500 [Ignavibacteriaceae bacterium]|nr:MAG: hypothetical protein EDM75_04560 [Chlorobiota bacterium]GJQ32011.1 MAG: hypothetical protein HBSAPP04_08500 [Ignavibacteriaceae bacterium]